MQTASSSQIVRFGTFEVDLRSAELRKNGLKLKLTGQPFQILSILLERPGEVVSREELQKRLWPDTFVDVDHSLNMAINKIREALGDSAENPRFVETLPRRGYRFIAPVEGANAAVVSAETVEALPHADDPSIGHAQVIAAEPQLSATRGRLSAVVWGGSILIAVVVLGWIFRTPLPSPKIVRTVQLTSDSLEKLGVFTDGSRVYFSEYRNGHWGVAAVSVSGGEVVPIRISFPDVQLINISPDKSQLLVTESLFKESPLWLVPVLGGAPRRLGNLLAHSGSWSPDGKKFAYTNGGDLYLAKPDGSESHRLLPQNLDRSVWAWLPTWSPDGTRLRFERYNMHEHTSTLWETTEAGDSLHAVVSGAGVQSGQCCSAWTPDGKYYLFNAWNDLVSGGFSPAANIWAIREKPAFFHRTSQQAVQLTAGPVHFWGHALSTDGKTIFALSMQRHGEMTRYDSKTQRFLPYLPGLSAHSVSFSMDGAWMAYVKYPQGELWRSKADGSEPLQLTFQPLVAVGSQWSPDGKRIAFAGQKIGGRSRLYVVSVDGGTPEQLLPELEEGIDPTWSPSGNSLLFGLEGWARHPVIQVLDLKTKQVSVIPGSEGLREPRWSPDGQHISALSEEGDRLLLFDSKTAKWTKIAEMDAGLLNWSRDAKYVYFVSAGADPGVFRVAIRDYKLEKVVSLKGFESGADGPWFSLTQNDEPVLLRELGGGTEIHALSWEAP